MMYLRPLSLFCPPYAFHNSFHHWTLFIFAPHQGPGVFWFPTTPQEGVTCLSRVIGPLAFGYCLLFITETFLRRVGPTAAPRGTPFSEGLGAWYLVPPCLLFGGPPQVFFPLLVSVPAFFFRVVWAPTVPPHSSFWA